MNDRKSVNILRYWKNETHDKFVKDIKPTFYTIQKMYADLYIFFLRWDQLC